MSTHQKLLWILVVLLAICMGVVGVDLYRVQTHQNDALSAIICHAEHLIRVTKGITPHQKHQALYFYEQQIRLEHLKPCKEGN